MILEVFWLIENHIFYITAYNFPKHIISLKYCKCSFLQSAIYYRTL